MDVSELDGLRKTREATLELVKDLDQRQMDYAPGKGRWSVGEVLDHLRLADELYVGEIRRLVELGRRGERMRLRRSLTQFDAVPFPLPRVLLPLVELPLTVANTLIPSALRNLVVNNRMVPAQRPSVLAPEAGRDAGELRYRLRESFEDLEELFRENPELPSGRMIHQHPLLGVNSVLDMIAFSRGHEKRHQGQIRDVLDHSGFPRRRRAA